MLRLFAFVALLMVVVGCGSSLKTTVRSPSGLASHMGSSTVALVFTDDEGVIRPYCSGVWLSDDEILTAGHCAAAIAKHIKGKDEGDVDPIGVAVHYIIQDEVTEVNKEPTAIHLAYVQAWDEMVDIALVKAVGKVIPSHESATIASVMPAEGEHVFIVGHPKGLYWSFIEGVVSSYRGDMGPFRTGPFVQISASVWFGNSGGGAFDSSGHLIGIASFLKGGPNTSFFVHPDNINKFLKGVKDKVEQHKEQKSLAE